ncbi:MAG: hypothetical protein ACJ8LG_05060 [Massilia sp.]
MKKIFLLVALCGAFYLHARTSFSESHITTWLGEHSAKAMAGEPSACDDYADDMEVVLRAEGRRGAWEVEGGKNQMCGYLKQSAAVFTVLQASTRAEFQDLRVVRDGFPWMKARVTYSQRTDVSAQRIPGFTIASEDELVLVRTLSGIKIRSVQSKSSGGL